MPVILIADDHPLFRRALVQSIRDGFPDATTIESGSLAQAGALLDGRDDIDLILLDLHMPDSRGLTGLSSLRARHPAVAVVMISAHEDPRTIRRALVCGAMGFIAKSASPDELALALATVLECRTYVPPGLADALAALPPTPEETLAEKLAALTAQQHRVLELVALGRLNKQIADALGIQERTVKAHLTAIFEKLGVRNRTQAGVLMRALDIGDPANALPA
jgi:DNA-binding NarL/FixJ family response regulator